MHDPTQGQWWSKSSTQLLQLEQCFDRGGRYRLHDSQNFHSDVSSGDRPSGMEA